MHINIIELSTCSFFLFNIFFLLQVKIGDKLYNQLIFWALKHWVCAHCIFCYACMHFLLTLRSFDILIFLVVDFISYVCHHPWLV